MRPVHEAAQLVPFIEPAETDPVADGDRDPGCNVDVVRDQQRIPVSKLQYEALVTCPVIVVRNQAFDEARVFDPTSGIAFPVA